MASWRPKSTHLLVRSLVVQAVVVVLHQLMALVCGNSRVDTVRWQQGACRVAGRHRGQAGSKRRGRRKLRESWLAMRGGGGQPVGKGSASWQQQVQQRQLAAADAAAEARP